MRSSLSILVFGLVFVVHLVGQGHQHVHVRPHFPEVEDFQLNISNSKFIANVNFRSDCFETAFRVGPEIEVGEDEFLVVLIFPDAYFGVVIHSGK